MAAAIRFLSGNLKGRSLIVAAGAPVRIGRDPECEACLEAGNVSRLHARLAIDGDDLTIENLSATNPIYVNGLKRPAARLGLWDVVLIGGSAFRVESLDLAAARPGSGRLQPMELPALDQREQYHTLLQCLLGIQKLLSEDGERLVERSLEMVFLALPVTRLSLFTIAEDGQPVQGFTTSRALSGGSHMSHGFARKVLEAGRAILLETVESADPSEWGSTLHEQAVRSILGVPVFLQERAVAVLLCDNLEQPGVLKDTHAQVLQFAGKSLEYVFQREALRKLEQKQLRAENEFIAAKRVQAQIFNKHPAAMAGTMRWAVHYQPALELGGDFYDFDESATGITWVVADVSGKGIPAALVVSMLKAFCKTLYPRRLAPSAFLAALDHLAKSELPEGMFFTCLVLQVSPHGELTWSNVGHPPAYVIHPDGRAPTPLPASAGMLGMDVAGLFAEQLADQRYTLAKGDRVFCCTDGAIEGHDAGGAMFGEQRLLRLLRDGVHADPERQLAEVVAAMSAHQGSTQLEDDLTLILGEW